MSGTEGIRRGSPTAFWNNATVAAAAVSPASQVGRKVNMFTLFVKSSGTATFTLQTAHVGSYSVQGILPDASDEAFVWHDLWYLGTSGLGNSTAMVIGGTGAFAIASIVPDFEVDWVRLKRTDAGADATVTAGYEGWGD